MNIIKLFESFSIDNRSEEEIDNFMSRKQAFRKMSKWGRNAALTALPLGLITAMPKMAFASPKDATSALQFALKLEYLEYHFYNHALEGADANLAFTPEELAAITLIRDHERAHFMLLADALGDNAVADPGYEAFDFTAGGAFPNVFTNKAVFLTVAQAFEDTGVRAYKGQAPELMNNNALLTTALQIHSVEARHAAHIRRMRIMGNYSVDPNEKAWVTAPDYDGIGSPNVAATAAVYQGEQNTTHAGLNATTVTDVPDLAVEEAWDEPLSMQEVINIARPFAPFL